MMRRERRVIVSQDAIMRSLIITANDNPWRRLRVFMTEGIWESPRLKHFADRVGFILLEFWCEEQARPLVVEPEFYRASRRHPQADRS
jgi:hypothetical protein